MSLTIHQPRSIGEALSFLADENARPLAGGASLVAMMNARLVTPQALVSLRHIPELTGIGEVNGDLRVGAMTSHRETAADARFAGTLALVRAAAGKIANPVIRNMGTMGGSISLADPGADYPTALVAVGAIIEIASPSTTRRVPARDFFLDWYTTALAPGELVIAITLPAARTGVSVYHKLARVAGDFATVAVALSADLNGEISIAIGGCGPTPIASEEANAALRGRLGDEAAAQRAGSILAALADPIDDVRASADYRRMVIPRMVVRAAIEASDMKAAA